MSQIIFLNQQLVFIVYSVPVKESTKILKEPVFVGDNLAIRLRDNAKALVHAAKFWGATGSCVVNYVLKEGFTATELTWDSASRSFKAARLRQNDNAAHLLGSIANALLTLLTETSIELVRQCEADDCTLWQSDESCGL